MPCPPRPLENPTHLALPNRAKFKFNKRIAFMAMFTLLGLNEGEIVAPEAELVQLMFDVAAHTCGEDSLVVWLREHTVPFEN